MTTAYDHTTTTDEIMGSLDLSGSTMVVTGATSGLGFETTRVLSKAGAKVIMAVRDLAKGEHCIGQLRELVDNPDLELTQLDLGDLRTARDAAAEILARHPAIDVLINNAGIMVTPQGYTDQGCELQFGTNHIGHFLFTNLLAPALFKGDRARVVSLSSAAHHYSAVDFDDPQYRVRPYDKWQAYGQSKTANILFAVALDRRWRDRGVRVNALHPGAIPTDLGRHLTQDERQSVRSTRTFWKTIPQGAATQVRAAVAPELEGVGGRFLEDCQLAEVTTDANKTKGVEAYAVDPDNAERLWELSERIVGQRFGY